MTDFSEKEEIIDTLMLFCKGIQTFGSKNFNRAVNSIIVSTEQHSHNKEIIMDYILNSVADEWKEYNYTKEDLLTPHGRGELAVARRMAMVLVREYIVGLSYKTISQFFRSENKQTVSNAVIMHNKMDSNNKMEALLLDKHERLTIKIIKFTNSLNKQ